MDPFADRLLENINQLQHLVAKQTYSPIELASGATDLVNEIEESKITGEEERYSGIDLVDFRGNLSGAIELVHELTPFLAENDPSLLDMINARNRMVEAALDRYEASPGYDDTGFVNYATVTTQERRDLSEVINASRGGDLRDGRRRSPPSAAGKRQWHTNQAPTKPQRPTPV